jgi:hypothetical protein
MKQETFAFMGQSDPEEESEVVLDEKTTEILVSLMASALVAVVVAASEVSDAG